MPDSDWTFDVYFVVYIIITDNLIASYYCYWLLHYWFNNNRKQFSFLMFITPRASTTKTTTRLGLQHRLQLLLKYVGL